MNYNFFVSNALVIALLLAMHLLSHFSVVQCDRWLLQFLYFATQVAKHKGHNKTLVIYVPALRHNYCADLYLATLRKENKRKAVIFMRVFNLRGGTAYGYRFSRLE